MNRPILEEFFSEELDAMERILERGRSGKHSEDKFRALDPFEHRLKAIAHGQKPYLALDRETGEPHILHAALRLMMAHVCAVARGRK